MTGWGARIDTDELQAHRIDFLIAKPFSRDRILDVLAQVDGQNGR